MESGEVAALVRGGVTLVQRDRLPRDARVVGHVLHWVEGQEAVAHLFPRAVAVKDGGVVIRGGEVTRCSQDITRFQHHRLIKTDIKNIFF